MARKDRKTGKGNGQPAKTTTQQRLAPSVQDLSIRGRSIDRSRKTLQTWKSAITMAESTINPTRVLLYDLYADILLDEHLTSVIEKRTEALTNTGLTFRLEGQDEPYEPVINLIETEAFEQVLEWIQESHYEGYSLINLECPYVESGDDLTPVVGLVRRANVVPSRSLVAPDPYITSTGYDYSQPPFTTNYFSAGKTDNLGLLIKAAPLVLIKRGDVSDWADFNEVFGQPFRVGYYNSYMPNQRATMEKAMDGMGGLAWMVLPDGTKIEFPNIDRSGTADTYERLADYMDKGLSKLILGNTMTTDAEGGKYKGDVHERVELKKARADRRYALKILNQKVVKLLVAQGWPIKGGKFDFVDDEEKLSKDKMIDMDLKLHEKVAPIPLDVWTKKYNVEFDKVALAEREKQKAAIQEQTNNKKDVPEKTPQAKPKDGKQQNAAEPELPEIPYAVLKRFALKLRSNLADFFDPAPKH